MKSLSCILLTLAILSGSAAAQPAQRTESGRDGVNQSFDRKAPGVGEYLPDVKAYDSSGNVIQLGQMKGNYSVVVFGCLT